MKRYIPPVDYDPNATYQGVNYPYSHFPAESTVQNTVGTNPACPVVMCSQCSGRNCKCNMNKMRDPTQRRVWKYLWNQY